MKNIQMVDLKGQYQKIKTEIDSAIQEVISSTQFIKGPKLKSFEDNLSTYLNCNHTIGCANGTDALQIALMALGLKQGDEVIVPTFTYVATAEVIALLGLKPVMADVDQNTFNLTIEEVQRCTTPKTKAIVPVHLYGQSTDMGAIMNWANERNIFVIEDNAQGIGADYTFSDGTIKKTGTIGHIGTTSFFPSKNLGCYGDGGAMSTNDEEIANNLKVISNHGQKKKYYHSVIGVNSRLDALQAAILDVKLKYLDDYIAARQQVAAGYDNAFAEIEEIETPFRAKNSSHVFHQYTLKVPAKSRDDLKQYLAEKSIPSMIYYPLPLYKQEAFYDANINPENFPVTNELCERVISLPIHTEMEKETLNYICENVLNYFK